MYAQLHHSEYRKRYEDDLKKMLPHIPRAAGFHTYASVGRELADLHVNYERVEPYPSVQEEASLHAPADPWERYRIGERKMRFPKLGRRDKDFTRLEYNDYVTLTGIPAEAQAYSISGRSPLEWIIDRHHVKTDKASGIVNDPNDFLREQGRPDAVVDLIKRLVTGLVWFCGPGVLRVVGCYWWCCAHWRAYWLGESQPSALWGCSSL